MASESARRKGRCRRIFPISGAIDGIFGPKTDAAVRALQAWAGQPPSGVVGDQTWFIWMTPGSAQQLTVEGASNLTDGLL